jgi:hypothetical protein
MNLDIKNNGDGTWSVLLNGNVIAANLSNREAWREFDKLSLEPISPSEEVGGIPAAIRATQAVEIEQAWYSALLKLAHDKGRKKGWAGFVFRDKFGKWPEGLNERFGPTFPELNMFLRDNRGRNPDKKGKK